MPDTLLPQLEEPEAREAVAEAVLTLLARWELHEVNQARLLGQVSLAECQQKILAGDRATLERAGYLLAIDRALLRAFAGKPQMRNAWIFSRHERLNGLSPLSVMLERGAAGMRVIKALADSGG